MRGARRGMAGTALVDKVPNFAAKEKRTPSRYALGVLQCCLSQGFWSDGVGVSGDGKMPPGRALWRIDREAAALTQCPILSQFT